LTIIFVNGRIRSGMTIWLLFGRMVYHLEVEKIEI